MDVDVHEDDEELLCEEELLWEEELLLSDVSVVGLGPWVVEELLDDVDDDVGWFVLQPTNNKAVSEKIIAVLICFFISNIKNPPSGLFPLLF